MKIFLAFAVALVLVSCKNKPEKAWESHIETGYQRSLEMKTRSDLEELRIAIGNYMLNENKMPQASNIFELMRVLRPKYLSQPVFYDAWNRELTVVNSSSSHIEVISNGIDGIRGTRDDVAIKM